MYPDYVKKLLNEYYSRGSIGYLPAGYTEVTQKSYRIQKGDIVNPRTGYYMASCSVGKTVFEYRCGYDVPVKVYSWNYSLTEHLTSLNETVET
jgi:hypothetical protein